MEKLYTVREVAAILQVNRNKAYELVKKGFIKSLNLGSIRVRESALQNFLETYDGMDISDLNNVRKIV